MIELQNIQSFQENFFTQILNSLSGIINLWDEILFALLLLIFGWLLGLLIEKGFIKLSEKHWVQNISHRIGFDEILKKADIKNSFGEVLGTFIKGYIITIFLAQSAKVVGITDISDFLEKFLFYIPKLVVAFIIILLGIQIANTTYAIISSGFKLIDSGSGKILAGIFKGIIITFSVLAALVYLEIHPFLVNALFIGFLTMIVIAGGLAFGLGGKQSVEKFLKTVEDDVQEEKGEEIIEEIEEREKTERKKK
jgi:hypothetical protein